MKNRLKEFNTPDTLLVLTSYPNPRNGKYGKRDFNAVGEHSERRLPYLAQKRKVLVAAEISGPQKYILVHKNLLVARVWKKRNILSFIPLLLFLLKQKHVRSILVQFEFNMLGGIMPNMMLLIVLVILRVSGRRITFEMHQVITDIKKLEKHIYIKNRVQQIIYNAGLVFYYISVGKIADGIVVFEKEIAQRLKKFVCSDKIVVLSLSVDKKKIINKRNARRRIKISQKEFVLLQFGFINGYKGLDRVIPIIGHTPDHTIRLLIAGGKNPYLKNQKHYQTFYKKIISEARKYKNITYRDFIPDEKVSVYFCAADLVILPYEVFMSASGPFSRALAHETPVILSKELSGYAKSADFRQALALSGLNHDDIFFNLNKHSLLRLVNKSRHDQAYYEQLRLFSKTLGDLRSIDLVTETLDQTLFPLLSISVAPIKRAAPTA